jgi:hypothetical protein
MPRARSNWSRAATGQKMKHMYGNGLEGTHRTTTTVITRRMAGFHGLRSKVRTNELQGIST